MLSIESSEGVSKKLVGRISVSAVTSEPEAISEPEILSTSELETPYGDSNDEKNIDIKTE